MVTKLTYNIDDSEFVDNNELDIDKDEFITNKLKENSSDSIKYETEILGTSTGDEVYQRGHASCINNFEQFITHLKTNYGSIPDENIDIIVKENEIIVEYYSTNRYIVTFISIK